MGPGGILVLVLVAAIVGYIFVSEKPFRKKDPIHDDPFGGLPKVSAQFAKAPEEMVARLTPAWQANLTRKLIEEDFTLIGDYSFASTLFFWARTFIAPDHKSALLLVNWVEGKEGGKVVISNLEIYSFTGDSFIVTACAQDGAAKLLTGANRPREDQISLHLKAVFAESAVRPTLEEHRQRLGEWEAKGAKVRELTKENILPSLSKIFS